MAGLVRVGLDNRPRIDVDWTGPHMSLPTSVGQNNQEFIVDTGAGLSTLDDRGLGLKLGGAKRQTVAGVGGATQLPMSAGITLNFQVTDPASLSPVTETYTGTVINTSMAGQVSVLGMDILCSGSGRRLCLTLDGRSATVAAMLER